MKHRNKPPSLFLRFFRWYCDPELRDPIEGDLMELYHERAGEGSTRKADIEFIIHVMLLFRPGIIRPVKGYENLNHNSMFKSYFKIGWRNLLRNKGYSFINIGGLAIGIAVTLLIGLWIYDELSFDKDNRKYHRVAQVIQHLINNGEVNTWRNVPYPLAEELRTHYGSDFKHIAMATQWDDHMLTFGDKKLKQTGGYFEKEAPEILDLKMVRGYSGLHEPASILISSTLAKTYFGDDDPINEVMKIDDLPVVKVVGVYEDFPRNSTFASLNFISTWDLVYANTAWMRNIDDPWRPNFTTLYVELNENADLTSVSAKIRDARLKKVNSQLAKKKPELLLHPMSSWHLYSEFKNGVNTGGAIQYVWMFAIVSMFVLLLACINFMNLSTARNEKRAKEVGIRKTIGSLRAHLVVQFFSESLLTVLFAFILALLLVQLTLPFFNEVANKQVAILWAHPTFWLCSFAFVTITALIAGSYPAFYLSSFRPIKVLKGTFKAGRFASVPRKVLVVIQFCVSVTLIIGTIIVYEQIQFAKDRPVGYSRSHLITIPAMSNAIHDHFDALREELIKTGAVVAMAEAQSPTTGIWNTTSGFGWKEKDPNMSIDFGVVNASYDYGKTIGWHIREGRGFSREFLSDSSAVILNEAAVRFMGLKNPVGETITWWGQPCTVIGVIDDMVMVSPYEETQPVVYALTREQGSIALIKLNAAMSAQEAISKIEPVFKKIDTDQPFEYQFVDEDYAKKFGNEERIGKLASVFAVLAIFISCLGLFGLASFVAEQRTKEIGIRKVLGASVGSLWKMLSGDFVMLVVVSCVIAAPVAYYFLEGWLQNYTYRTSISVWVFTATFAGALLITLLTVSVQAIRAAVANPVKSLRSE